MKTRNLNIIAPVVLAGGLVLAACSQDGSTPREAEEALSGMTVIDAVQLGADQGCHGLADRVSGSVSIQRISGSEDLVLLLEDGYPLCLDTMENAAREIRDIEDSYRREAMAETEGRLPVDGLKPMMINTNQSDEDGSPDKTDPNPQPAISNPTPTVLTAKSDIKTQSEPSATGDASPPVQN